MNNVVINPYEYFADPTKGRPIFNGFVYIGEPDTDPEVPANQKQVYARQDDGNDVAIPQPVLTNAGGYPTYNGSVIAIVVNGPHSLKVNNKDGSQILYSSNNYNGVATTEDYGSVLLATDAQAIAGTPGVIPNAEQVRRNHVAQVATIADLRALEPAFDGQQTELLGHTVAGIGGGVFYHDASSAAADNNGITIVTAGGNRWVRKLEGFVTPEMFGAIGDGVADAAPAINEALSIGGHVYLPAPTTAYLILSPLTVSVPNTVFEGAGLYAKPIIKGFNGEMITVAGSGSRLVNLSLSGDGANFTGGGIKPIGYNVLTEHCRIVDTEDSPIIFDPAIGSNAFAGTYAEVNHCFLLPTDLSATYSIRSTGSDDSILPTIRTFRNINGGGPLVDFSGMNRAILTDSFGTIMKFSSTSSKICINCNRMTNGAININVLGNDHDIDNNIWSFSSGGSVSIDSTTANVHWGPSNNIVVGSSSLAAPVVGAAVGAAMPNNIHTNLISYADSFAWFGSTTNGSFGNSAVSAYYKLSGRHCYTSFSLLMGSTATTPIGTWSVQLPFKAYVTSVHPILVKSSSGTYYTAILEVQGGSSTAVIYIDTLAGAMTEASIAFGTGGILQGTLNYLVSPA